MNYKKYYIVCAIGISLCATEERKSAKVTKLFQDLYALYSSVERAMEQRAKDNLEHQFPDAEKKIMCSSIQHKLRNVQTDSQNASEYIYRSLPYHIAHLSDMIHDLPEDCLQEMLQPFTHLVVADQHFQRVRDPKLYRSYAKKLKRYYEKHEIMPNDLKDRYTYMELVSWSALFTLNKIRYDKKAYLRKRLKKMYALATDYKQNRCAQRSSIQIAHIEASCLIDLSVIHQIVKKSPYQTSCAKIGGYINTLSCSLYPLLHAKPLFHLRMLYKISKDYSDKTHKHDSLVNNVSFLITTISQALALKQNDAVKQTARHIIEKNRAHQNDIPYLHTKVPKYFYLICQSALKYLDKKKDESMVQLIGHLALYVRAIQRSSLSCIEHNDRYIALLDSAYNDTMIYHDQKLLKLHYHILALISELQVRVLNKMAQDKDLVHMTSSDRAYSKRIELSCIRDLFYTNMFKKPCTYTHLALYSIPLWAATCDVAHALANAAEQNIFYDKIYAYSLYSIGLTSMYAGSTITQDWSINQQQEATY